MSPEGRPPAPRRLAGPWLLLAGILAALGAARTAGGGEPGPASLDAAWGRAPGRVVFWTSRANGGRTALLFVPSALDPSRPVRLLVYFHGHGGDVGEKLLRGGVVDRVGEVAAARPQSLFLFPQAASAPFGYWMRAPESLRALTEEALDRAEGLLGRRPPVGERVVDAHSGGGLALKNAVQAGELVADQVDFLDAAYGDWGQEVVCWALAEERAGHRVRLTSWWTPHSTLPRNNAQMLSWAPRLLTAFETEASHGDVPARFAFASTGESP